MRRPPKYCHHKQDRHGGAGFWYYERRGFPRIRLPGLPWSPEFMAAYEAAIKGKPLPIGAKNVPSGSMADLIAKYYASAAFLGLERSTQQVYHRIVEKIREDHGHRAVADLEAKYIRILAARIQKPTAAKRFISILRVLLAHGVECGLIERNPAEGIKGPKVKTVGFHSWTEGEIAQFEARHEAETRERLALALLLYTGQRRSDVVRMGPQHVRDGELRIVQKKTRAELSIPVHPELAAIIETWPGGHMAFLVTAHGKPFTAAGFGNWFREACNAAGLPHCSAHGLRKAAARRLADAGATEHEIAAITGHESLREVERYAKGASQARLAKSAQAKVIAAFPRTKGERNT
jgi:integrase